MTTPRTRRYFFATYPFVVAGAVLLGIFFMWLVATTVADRERVSLAQRAATISAGIEAYDISALSATPDDIGTAGYERLKDVMRRIRWANDDVRFVYVFVKRGDEIIFLVDSEEPESDDYSAPGDVYYEATPALKSVFTENHTIVEGPETDRWGTWVSGLAPILDADGAVVGVAGIDIDARSYYVSIAAYTAVPLLLALIMIIVALFGKRLRLKEEELFRTKFRFLSVASHELRSPLAGIVWGAENILTKGGPGLDANERRTLTLIRDAARYMSDTVADILTASRLEADTSRKLLREVVDLAQLVRDVASTLAFYAEKDGMRVVFERGFPEHLPYPCDREKMRRVFSNVIANAIKYSHPGGIVTVSFGRDKDGYVFMVGDEGIGIPENEQRMIFTTYYRAKNAEHHSAQGTGMGLYFTKEIVELHGGKIWFESEENKGTTVHIFLPEMKTGELGAHQHA